MTLGMRRSHDVSALLADARNGDPRAVARLVTLVENGGPALPSLAAALAPFTGQAQVIGLTGAPGVGKSTITNELVRAYRGEGRRVGVLAVDPSSPFSGGALLGDRIRMQDHATDPGVFIRSMSSRGQLGGLSAATPQAVRVLEGAGCEVVLVETVGVGQAEVEVASLADTTVVLLAPGMGDAIQAVKAGILEIGDVFVVNKADRDGADATYRDIQGMIALGERGPGGWRPPVVRAVASRGEGIDDVVAAIAKHRAWLAEHAQLHQRRVRRAMTEVEGIALGAVRARLASVRAVPASVAGPDASSSSALGEPPRQDGSSRRDGSSRQGPVAQPSDTPHPGTALEALAAEVATGTLDAYTAARRLLALANLDPSLASDPVAPDRLI